MRFTPKETRINENQYRLIHHERFPIKQQETI
ncbi:MAG: hypothetical protein ACJA1C_000494 [Crocinitomicaceae bacterium]|jgi:hypothetical protein